jgi:hypothetical protein
VLLSDGGTEGAGELAGVVGVFCAEGWGGAAGVVDGGRCGCCDVAAFVGDGLIGVCIVLCCVVVDANKPTAMRKIPKMIRMYQSASFSRIRAHIVAASLTVQRTKLPPIRHLSEREAKCDRKLYGC